MASDFFYMQQLFVYEADAVLHCTATISHATTVSLVMLMAVEGHTYSSGVSHLVSSLSC